LIRNIEIVDDKLIFEYEEHIDTDPYSHFLRLEPIESQNDSEEDIGFYFFYFYLFYILNYFLFIYIYIFTY
jgi:hypothetical protein